MSTVTKILVSVPWDLLEEIDRRAAAVGMSRSRYMVLASVARTVEQVQMQEAVEALRTGLVKYDAITKKES